MRLTTPVSTRRIESGSETWSLLRCLMSWNSPGGIVFDVLPFPYLAKRDAYREFRALSRSPQMCTITSCPTISHLRLSNTSRGVATSELTESRRMSFQTSATTSRLHGSSSILVMVRERNAAFAQFITHELSVIFFDA